MPDPRELMPPPPSPPLKRHPLLVFFMILGGLILLLPGACVLAFFTPPVALGDLMIWLACMAISAGGIFVIANAFRRPRSHDFNGGPGNPDRPGGYR